MEQRIKVLEEEVKVVKNEIQAVLLDIREHYLNINNPFTRGLPKGGLPPDEGKELPGVEPDQDEPPTEKLGADEQVKPIGTPKEPGEEPTPAPAKHRQRDKVDLITIASLSHWADQATARIGKERVEALVEVSHTMGRLPPGLSETLTKLVRFSQAKPSNWQVTAKDYLAVLVQLENLLGQSTQPETALLSFLEEGDQP